MTVSGDQRELVNLNRWLAISGALLFLTATVSCSLLGWLALSVNQLSNGVVAIRTELDLVKPADVLAAVYQVRQEQLTETEVRQLVNESSPWSTVRREWDSWRKDCESRLQKIESEVKPASGRP